MRNLFHTKSEKRRLHISRLSVLPLVVLALVMCFYGAVYADEKQSETGTAYAEVRMVGKKAYLYNPATGSYYKGLKKVKQIPAGSGNYYYFRNKNGLIYNNGFFKAGKRTYYAQKNGITIEGLAKPKSDISEGEEEEDY